MDAAGVVAIVVSLAACIALVALGSRSRLQRRRRQERAKRETQVFGFETEAQLLGSLPSEHQAEHSSPERQILDVDESPEIELRDQRPRAFHMLELDDEENYRHHFIPDETIEQCISHAIVEFHREEVTFCAVDNPIEVDRLLAEAHDLLLDLNQEFGWQPGEPHIADRMFNTNVAAVLTAAHTSGKIDFRTHRMIAVMRSFGRAANGGRNELAKVMAVRRLLGAGRLTEEELQKLHLHRRLFGDEFAEAAGYVDHLTRTDEIVAAKRLGIAPSKETARDREGPGGRGRNLPAIEIGRDFGRNTSRSFERRS
jgi:hypothetical protein